MLSPIGAAAGKAGHPFDKLRTGVRLLANKKPQVKIWGFFIWMVFNGTIG
jgi:hypothetical protein